MSEKSTRIEYDKNLPVWRKIRDCMTGETAIKERRTDYLPMPNSLDKSKENLARYDAYLQRAVFYNITGRTVEGLQSMMFTKPPTFALGGVDYLEDDVDGAGTTLAQQSKRAALDTLSLGRHGLLADFPQNDQPSISRRDVGLGVRATIQEYRAENILNWRTEKIGAVRKLTLVVLREDYDDGSGGLFLSEIKDQYRVLRLDENGLYVQEVYREGEIAEGPFEPRDGKGSRLSEIPFVFLGAENNDDTIDKAPAEDIATLNIGHYRNSADYEESVFLLGQPTLFIMTDMDKSTFDAYNPQGVMMGSRSAHVLSETSKVQLLQMSETSAAKEAMAMKEEQAVKIGAKLIESRGQTKTAFQARSDSASETSVLLDVSQNVSSGYTQALKWVAMFMNTPGDNIEYLLSEDFGIDELTVEERQQLMSEWQAGLISRSIARMHLRTGAVIPSDISDEKIDSELDSELPGLGLDEEEDEGGGQ